MNYDIDLTDPDEALTFMTQLLNKEFEFEDDLRGRDYYKGLWKGKMLVVPPFDERFIDWIMKAYESSRAGATVVVICPARTADDWFHEGVLNKADDIRFTSYSIPFQGYGGKNKMYMPAVVAIYRPLASFIMEINTGIMGHQVKGQVRVMFPEEDAKFAAELCAHLKSVPKQKLARQFADFLIRR